MINMTFLFIAFVFFNTVESLDVALNKEFEEFQEGSFAELDEHFFNITIPPLSTDNEDTKYFAQLIPTQAVPVCVATSSIAPPEQIAKFKRVHEECQSNGETSIEESIMEKFFSGLPVEDPKLGAHCFCMNLKLGIQNDNGDVDAAELRTLAKDIFLDRALTEKIVDRCAIKKPELATPDEAAIHLINCSRDIQNKKLEKIPGSRK